MGQLGTEDTDASPLHMEGTTRNGAATGSRTRRHSRISRSHSPASHASYRRGVPGDEILDLGRGKQRPAPPPRQLTHDVEPVQVDVQGQDEEEPPPRPQRVKVTLGAVVGVVSGLLVGAAASTAIDDWREETAARRATELAAVLEQTGAMPDSESLSATFTIFNSGEHPITIEGITLAGWESAVADRRLSREIDPGENATVLAYLAVDCANPGSRPATEEAVVEVRTVDGRRHTVNVAVAQWEQLAESRGWICSPPATEVWADLISPAWGEGSLTLSLQLHSDRKVTVVGVESLSPAFSVETTQLPVTNRGGGGGDRAITTTWRVVDCVAAQGFELSGVFLRLTLDNGRTQEIDLSYGQGFGSLIRLTERSCPS